MPTIRPPLMSAFFPSPLRRPPQPPFGSEAQTRERERGRWPPLILVHLSNQIAVMNYSAPAPLSLSLSVLPLCFGPNPTLQKNGDHPRRLVAMQQISHSAYELCAVGTLCLYTIRIDRVLRHMETMLLLLLLTEHKTRQLNNTFIIII